MTLPVTGRLARRFTVQEPVFHVLPWVVKESSRYQSIGEFKEHLAESLPWGSAAMRRRFTPEVLRIFRDGDLDSLVTRVWDSYQDEGLLQEIIRVEWLSHTPPQLGRFVTDWLPRFAPGESVGEEARQAFLAAEPTLHDPNRRLLKTIERLGFLRKEGREFVVARLAMPRTAFFLSLLDRLAPARNTVQIGRIIADPFWRYLGGRDEAEVRRVLTEAEAASLLRQERVDQLDQVTPRIALSEALKRKVRL